MAVYLLNMALILLWAGLLIYKNPTDQNKKMYCGLVAIQWTLISGLRHISIGADTEAYKMYFEQAKNVPWQRAFENCWKYLFDSSDELKDPGYTLVQKIFQIFCKDYQVFLLFIGALFSILLAIWVYKHSKMPCLSFVIYSSLFYSFFAITGHRQTIATSLIVFIGYEFIKQRKLVKFLLISFVACLIHKSAMIFIPFYFIANIPVTKVYVTVSLLIIAIVTALGERIYAPIVEFVGYEKDKLENEYSATTFAFVLLLVCAAVLLLYPLYKDNCKNPRHIFNVTLLTLLTDLAVFQFQGFMRVQQYFSLFIMLSIPEAILCVNKRSKPALYLLCIFVLIAYLFMNNPQYRFCF